MHCDWITWAIATISSGAHRWRRVILGTVLLLGVIWTLARSKQQSDPMLSFTTPKGRPTQPLFPPIPDGCPLAEELPSSSMTNFCDSFPSQLLSTIQVVIKTGAGEGKRTETMLGTMASCISNALIVSDAYDELAGHQVHDILSELPESYAFENPDWTAYTELKRKLSAHEVIDKSHDVWKLDRFKFLPMVEKAFEVAPKAQWYFFIEADIYVIWDTLFRFLGTMDPNQYHYIGSAAPGSHGVWFAYGGGGIIMSGKLVRAILREGQQRLSVKYEQMVKDDCCGDAVLAYVIHRELRHHLKAPFPTFSGEEPNWLRVGKHNWCSPLLDLHHVSESQMKALWTWERCRSSSLAPITHADFLEFALAPVIMPGSIAGWDNRPDYRLLDDDDAHRSLQACELACTSNSTCLQYNYSREYQCRISDFVCVGEKNDNELQQHTSGWSLPRLQKMGFRVET